MDQSKDSRAINSFRDGSISVIQTSTKVLEATIGVQENTTRDVFDVTRGV